MVFCGHELSLNQLAGQVTGRFFDQFYWFICCFAVPTCKPKDVIKSSSWIFCSVGSFLGLCGKYSILMLYVRLTNQLNQVALMEVFFLLPIADVNLFQPFQMSTRKVFLGLLFGFFLHPLNTLSLQDRQSCWGRWIREGTPKVTTGVLLRRRVILAVTQAGTELARIFRDLGCASLNNARFLCCA